MNLQHLLENAPRDVYGNIIKPFTPRQWIDQINNGFQQLAHENARRGSDTTTRSKDAK